MIIPRYWAKVTKEVELPSRRWGRSTPQVFTMKCWRWSDTSHEEARRLAQAALNRRIESLLNNERNSAEYQEPTIREEILREFRNPEGKLDAAITRSRLGYRVLNTEMLPIIDADFKEAKSGLLSIFKKKLSPADQRAQWENKAMELMEATFQDMGLGGRLYRTANGLRAFVTTEKISAQDERSFEVLDRCGADYLYKHLCELQSCYRARLSPKPHRLGLSSPKIAFPAEDDAERERVSKWLQNYNESQKPFGTCSFVKRIGVSKAELVEFREIIDLHDRETRALEGTVLR